MFSKEFLLAWNTFYTLSTVVPWTHAGSPWWCRGSCWTPCRHSTGSRSGRKNEKENCWHNLVQRLIDSSFEGGNALKFIWFEKGWDLLPWRDSNLDSEIWTPGEKLAIVFEGAWIHCKYTLLEFYFFLRTYKKIVWFPFLLH